MPLALVDNVVYYKKSFILKGTAMAEVVFVLGMIAAFFFFKNRAEQARTTAGKVLAAIPAALILLGFLALRMS